jgi:hypothetical protein
VGKKSPGLAAIVGGHGVTVQSGAPGLTGHTMRPSVTAATAANMAGLPPWPGSHRALLAHSNSMETECLFFALDGFPQMDLRF